MIVHKTQPVVIVLEHTTPEQLGLVTAELESCLDNTPEDTASWWSLFNILCDLEVEGYEAP